MTTNDGLDRVLADWLEDETAPRARDGAIDTFAARVPATRQRPAWATTERWASLETRARFGAAPRALVVAASVLLLTLAVAATIAIGSSLLQQRLPEPFGPAGNGMIMYSTADAVWAVDVDGGEPRQLTPDDEFAAAVYWSPDGTRFSYESLTSSPGEGCTGQHSASRGRCEPARKAGPEVRVAPRIDHTVTGSFLSRQVVVRDSDGTNPIVLTDAIANTPGPHAWSPDGERVAFSRSLADPESLRPPCSFKGAFCGSRIFVASADGAGYEQIGDPDLDAMNPVWSPSGEVVFFVGSPAGTARDFRFYRMDADGSNVEPLGDWAATAGRYFGAPHQNAFRTIDLSPDGTAIATQREGQIGIVEVATGAITKLTHSFDHDSASWSPDGTQILATRYNGPAGRSRPVVIDVERGIEREYDVWIDGATWSPDGTSIVGRAWDDASVVVVDLTQEDAGIETTRQLPASEHATAVDWQRVAR